MSASKLADWYQYGDKKYKKLVENKSLYEDCIWSNYDWEMMSFEDRYCDDKDYIPNLVSDLQKRCNCSYHYGN